MMNLTKLVGLGGPTGGVLSWSAFCRSRVPAAFGAVCRQSAECVVMGWMDPALTFQNGLIVGQDGYEPSEEERGRVQKVDIERWV
jgi:hypothetical protein